MFTICVWCSKCWMNVNGCRFITHGQLISHTDAIISPPEISVKRIADGKVSIRHPHNEPRNRDGNYRVTGGIPTTIGFLRCLVFLRLQRQRRLLIVYWIKRCNLIAWICTNIIYLGGSAEFCTQVLKFVQIVNQYKRFPYTWKIYI